MGTAFCIAALLTLLGGVGSMCFRNLVHCAFALAVSFVGLAACYLLLGAEFVGFAQVLVYVGAVAILIVIAMLLTRNIESKHESLVAGGWVMGVCVAVLASGSLILYVVNNSVVQGPISARPTMSTRALGEQLMGDYVMALEGIGLLLTASLIGAVVIALREKEER